MENRFSTEKIVSTINRDDLESLLVNKGQNSITTKMVLFSERISQIEELKDLKLLDYLFFSNFKLDKTTKKFEYSSAEIFERETYSGCSDIGLALAPILRMKNIPTVYVESANIEWIKDVQEDNENKNLMRGHIFLEIYLSGTWYLYDPTFHLVYSKYDYNNLCLPRGYVVFAKSLNCHELGIHSIQDEKKLGTTMTHNFNLNKYLKPDYEVIDLRRININKIIE